jgi:hypothetical protein
LKPRAFTSEEERFLIAQLNQSDDRIATKALQWLCERCRAGFFFAEPANVRATIRLSLHRSHPNARRWAVNALTEIGPGPDVSPILALIASTENDPDLLAAIVAAIFSSRSEDEAIELLGARNIHMEGLALIAASQFSFNQKRALVEQLVPLETADDANLRSAIVLAGTKKAPEHLFHRRHPNAIALSELNLHDCPSVSKYSIWALAQLELGYSSLLLPEDRIESSPDEIRKWVFRLLISDPPELVKRLDLFGVIQNDPSVEVREESAIELRDSFAPGIDRIVSHWFFREEHAEARALLLDHMAAQSHMSARYAPIVIEMYKKSQPKSAARERLEAAAAKTPLFRELRRIAITEEHGLLFANDNELFGGGATVTNINIHGGQIGAITGSGDITGETIAAIAQVQNADAKEILTKVFEVVGAIESPKEKAEAESAVKDAANKQTKSAWKRVLSVLKGVKSGALAIKDTVTDVDELIHTVGELAG